MTWTEHVPGTLWSQPVADDALGVKAAELGITVLDSVVTAFAQHRYLTGKDKAGALVLLMATADDTFGLFSIGQPAAQSSKALNYWSLEEIGQATNVAAYPNVADNWPFICRAASLWGIDHPLVLMGMIGTIAQESGTFYPVREAWWVYDVNPGFAMSYYADTSLHAEYQGGPWYHGRGYIQTTHIDGYQLVKDSLAEIGIDADTVGNPELLLQPEYAAHALCIYFLRHWPNQGMITACLNRQWSEVRRAVYGAYDTRGAAKLQYAESVLLPIAQRRELL